MLETPGNELGAAGTGSVSANHCAMPPPHYKVSVSHADSKIIVSRVRFLFHICHIFYIPFLFSPYLSITCTACLSHTELSLELEWSYCLVPLSFWLLIISAGGCLITYDF